MGCVIREGGGIELDGRWGKGGIEVDRGMEGRFLYFMK